MRFLHTADWHLGRIYYGLSLLEDQAHLLDQFVALVREKEPDVVIIAGDVYDRSVPPTEAVRLLNDTLKRIVIDEGTRVILIAGNHDSADRLGFGSDLLSAAGLFVRGVPDKDKDIDPVIVEDEHGEVAIYPLPYANPAQVSELLGNQEITSHHAALTAQMDRIRSVHRNGRRGIVVAHAFVQGGQESESENSLSVGGSGVVSADAFAGMDYVALGHLHRPQTVGDPRIHYSGSLMKYSFNEADQAKSISLVELDAEGAKIERIALIPRRDLRILEGTLQELISAGANDPGKEDFILARLTDTGALLDAMNRLRMAYPNALNIDHGNSSGIGTGLDSGQNHLQVKIEDLFSGFYKDVTGKEIDEEAMAMLIGEIDALGNEEREAAS